MARQGQGSAGKPDAGRHRAKGADRKGSGTRLSASRWQAWSEAYLRVSGFVVQTISIIVLALMVAINAVNITTRALLHTDLEWTQEVSIVGAMVIYFFSIALIPKANADIRIEFLVRMLPGGWQHTLGIMSRLAVLGFQCMVLWLAIDTLSFVSIFRTPVLEISEAVFFVPVIAGAVDIVVTEIIHLTQQWRGELPPPGAGAVH